MSLVKVKRGETATAAQIQQVLDILQGADPPAGEGKLVAKDFTSLSEWGSRYGLTFRSPDYYYRFDDYPNWAITIKEPETVAKTARSYYQFLLVFKDDTFDIQGLIAEDEQSARDTLIQDLLPDGVKVKDVEIVKLHAVALKPKVTKDG